MTGAQPTPPVRRVDIDGAAASFADALRDTLRAPREDWVHWKAAVAEEGLDGTAETVATALRVVAPLADTEHERALRSANQVRAETLAPLRYGVGAGDLQALGQTMGASPYTIANVLHSLLFRQQAAFTEPLVTVAPDLPLADAIRWALIVWDRDRSFDFLDAEVAKWQEVDLASAGWLYWAAGLTPAEASRADRAGALDAAALVTLAGLRGIRLPPR